MAYKFSPSSLSLLKDCPRCFWLQFVKGIRHPDTPFPSLPSGMDRILKAHFDAFRDRNELPPELQQLNGEVKLFDDRELLAEINRLYGASKRKTTDRQLHAAGERAFKELEKRFK